MKQNVQNKDRGDKEKCVYWNWIPERGRLPIGTRYLVYLVLVLLNSNGCCWFECKLEDTVQEEFIITENGFLKKGLFIKNCQV